MSVKSKKVEKNVDYIASKKNAAEKRREKLNSLAAIFKDSKEPETDPFDYKLSLIRVFNWYNISVDLKTVRSYVNDYLISTERKKLIPTMNQVSDFDIRSLGFLCRLKMRGQYLEELHELSIEENLGKLLASVDTTPKQVQVVKKIKTDNTYELSVEHSEGFEEAIDNFVKNKKTDFNALDYLKAKEIPATVSKKIGQYYASVLAELKEAQTDEDLKEGYSNFTSAQLRKFITLVESMVTACNQQIQSVKVVKPRTAKPVTPIKLVSNLKYMKEFVELSLKSIQPTSIITKSELWTYNTKYKKLAIYKAEKGNKLTIKGTSILGYDVSLSKQVTIRKPDVFFKNTPIAKMALLNGMKEVKTKLSDVNNRINEDTILLGAW
jgi:hypothetical protein